MDEQQQLKIIGQRIKAARKALKLRQVDVAHRIDVDLREYQRFEAGERNFTVRTLGRIAEALNMDLNVELLNPRESDLWVSVGEGPQPAGTIPYFDNLEVAAGYFDALSSSEVSSWMKLDRKGSLKNYFAAPVVGDSMEPDIPNGSICLFQKYQGGSRQNKLMLFERKDLWDADLGAQYLIKKYKRLTEVSDDDDRSGVKIELHSLNTQYDPIVLSLNSEEEISTPAEFIEVLK